MRHRFVPLPVQSLIMVATLMLGPVGFLAYWLVRVSRTRRAVAWGERGADSASDTAPAPRFTDVVGRRPVAAIISLWKRDRALFALDATAMTTSVSKATSAQHADADDDAPVKVCPHAAPGTGDGAGSFPRAHPA
jgi:hypothetical protein